METKNKEYRIRLHHDSDARNPFEEGGAPYPIIYKLGYYVTDMSEGDIDNYIVNYLDDTALIANIKEVQTILQSDRLTENLLESETDDERAEYIREEINEFIGESLDNRAQFCSLFGILHYFGRSVGYSQGDVSDVLIVPTPEHAQACGYSIEDIELSSLKSTFDLFGHWAWSDVYIFEIEEKVNYTKIYEDGTKEQKHEWRQVDSCAGFFGPNYVENGMIDYINPEQYGWTREECLEILENTEIEYRY